MDVNLTRATNLIVVADQVPSFMALAFFSSIMNPATLHTKYGNVLYALTTKIPDLNSIKPLWDMLELQSVTASSHNLQDMKVLLFMSWCQIPQGTFRGLVESMAR